MKQFADMTTEEKAVWTIRFLSADMIQNATSGHPGLPLGAADMAFVLWHKFLRFNPVDSQLGRTPATQWAGRDRFVLSAGHGSALLYSLLHLYGFDVSMEQLKRFRQLGSITPGHPEYGLTPGVETTTGPLGQGLANAVGMALAMKILHERLHDKDDWSPIADSRVFALVGDGCLMEGISHEVASLAGYLELDNLIVLWDDNSITIDGPTDLTSADDMISRFKSYAWATRQVKNGNDAGAIEGLFPCEPGRSGSLFSVGGPLFMAVSTTIGYGCSEAGSEKTHGSPLGEDTIREMRESVGWPSDEPFFVPDEVRALCQERVAQIKEEIGIPWDRQYRVWYQENLDKAKLWDEILSGNTPSDLLQTLIESVGDAERATRAHFGVVLQSATKAFSQLIGGSADLAPSNKTWIKGTRAIKPGDFRGRNMHFGVREHGMAGIMNGMALSGLIPFGGTFLVFADYMKPSIRMAVMMKLGVIYVFTHDSIFVGEDGPTHQPVEQLSMLRAIPNLVVYRPADGLETAAGWTVALQKARMGGGPTALILSRQKLSNLKRPSSFRKDLMLRGGYVVRYETQQRPAQPVIIATGSEVALALEVAEDKWIDARVVSMPSREIFLSQELNYQKEVIPPNSQVAVIEASLDDGWHRLARGGPVIGMDEFGASAPNRDLAERFSFTKDGVLTLLSGWPEPR